MYCPKCGKMNREGSRSCADCGKSFVVSSERKSILGIKIVPGAKNGGESRAGGMRSKIWVGVSAAIVAALIIAGVTVKADYDSGETLSQKTANSYDVLQLGVRTTPAPHEILLPTVKPTQSPTQRPMQSPTPTPKSGPGQADIKGHDSRLVEPKSDAWLDEYDIRFVQSTGGVSIYLRWGPSTDYDYFDTVKEAEPVTVLAEQNDFSLVLASGDRLGWCKSALIVSESDQIAPVPSLKETYWTYLSGQTMGTTYACLFHSDGTYSAYSYSGIRLEGSYRISGRRLTLDGIRFLWNGSKFVSTEKHEMQIGSDYLIISPDPDASYEDFKALYEGLTTPSQPSDVEYDLAYKGDGRYDYVLTYNSFLDDERLRFFIFGENQPVEYWTTHRYACTVCRYLSEREGPTINLNWIYSVERNPGAYGGYMLYGYSTHNENDFELELPYNNDYLMAYGQSLLLRISADCRYYDKRETSIGQGVEISREDAIEYCYTNAFDAMCWLSVTIENGEITEVSLPFFP